MGESIGDPFVPRPAVCRPDARRLTPCGDEPIAIGDCWQDNGVVNRRHSIVKAIHEHKHMWTQIDGELMSVNDTKISWQ